MLIRMHWNCLPVTLLGRIVVEVMHFLPRGCHEEAFKDFDISLEYDPNNPVTLLDRGNVWFHRGRREHALKDYDRALAIDPSFASALTQRGLCFSERRITEALACYDRALA